MENVKHSASSHWAKKQKEKQKVLLVQCRQNAIMQFKRETVYIMCCLFPNVQQPEIHIHGK